MFWSDDLKEVFFNEYCASCKHFGVAEDTKPCYECLAEPANSESHKPVKWEGKD